MLELLADIVTQIVRSFAQALLDTPTPPASAAENREPRLPTSAELRAFFESGDRGLSPTDWLAREARQTPSSDRSPDTPQAGDAATRNLATPDRTTGSSAAPNAATANPARTMSDVPPQPAGQDRDAQTPFALSATDQANATTVVPADAAPGETAAIVGTTTSLPSTPARTDQLAAPSPIAAPVTTPTTVPVTTPTTVPVTTPTTLPVTAPTEMPVTAGAPTATAIASPDAAVQTPPAPGSISTPAPATPVPPQTPVPPAGSVTSPTPVPPAGPVTTPPLAAVANAPNAAAGDVPQSLRDEREHNPNFGGVPDRPHPVEHTWDALAQAPVHGTTVDPQQFAALHLAQSAQRPLVAHSWDSLALSPARFGDTGPAAQSPARGTPPAVVAPLPSHPEGPPAPVDTSNSWPPLPPWPPPAVARTDAAQRERTALRDRVQARWYV